MDPCPDSWEPENVRPWVSERYMHELCACEAALAEARKRIDPWSGRDVDGAHETSADDIVVAEMSRGFTTFAGAVDLCRSGFGRQAAMLNRSLFEGMAVAHWVHVNPEEALAVFHSAARFESHLTAGVVEAVGWEKEVDERTLADAKLNEQEMPPYIRQFGRFGERLWTGRSLYTLVLEIEDQWTNEESRKMLWDFFRIAHRDNNQVLHSSISALRETVVGGDGDSRSIRFGASEDHVGEALWAAHWTFGNLFTLAIDRFELDGKQAFISGFEQQQFDFVLQSDSTWGSVGRNDLCPCGSGVKFKRCHEDKVKAARARNRSRPPQRLTDSNGSKH